MGIREKLKETPALGIGVAVVLVGLAIFLSTRPKESAAYGGQWYYNLEAGGTEVVKTEETPGPRTLPSGKAGVPARVFGCSGCEGETFVGYLEKYTSREDGPGVSQSIAAVPKLGEEPQWVNPNSAAGQQIVQMPDRRCGKPARQCQP